MASGPTADCKEQRGHQSAAAEDRQTLQAFLILDIGAAGSVEGQMILHSSIKSGRDPAFGLVNYSVTMLVTTSCKLIAVQSMILISPRCIHCGSFIAHTDGDDSVECGICDFVHPAITLLDAMISKAIRLSESVDRVEMVLDRF